MLKQVSIAGILAVVTASGACAADAMTVGDTAKGKDAGKLERHDAVHVRQRPGRQSTCNGPCATNWPPLMAMADATAPSLIVMRDDGSKQWAYKGKPF